VKTETGTEFASRLTEFTFFRGRVALHAILKALGVTRGDSVALQAFTCVAVPEAILAATARPLFIDVTPDGFTMDSSDLERKLTPQTKAIVVQHTFGIPGAVAAIEEIATGRGVPLIEDCCHSYLSAVGGRCIGSFGAASFYSFEWGKPLVAGMGGSAVAGDDELRQKLHQQHVALWTPPWARNLRIEAEYLGYRLLFRPRLYWFARRLKGILSGLAVVESSYNAVYGEGKSSDFVHKMAPSSRRRLLRKAGEIQRVARYSEWITSQYRSRIGSPYVMHPAIEPNSSVVFGRYPLSSAHKQTILRLAARAMVEVAGWYSTPVHPLAPEQWAQVGYSPGCCPCAEQRAAEVLTLPTHVKVTQCDIDRTVEFFNSLKI
jgi:dTDP-4-amino-4,6-dideoxygalactose transaminase